MSKRSIRKNRHKYNPQSRRLAETTCIQVGGRAICSQDKSDFYMRPWDFNFNVAPHICPSCEVIYILCKANGLEPTYPDQSYSPVASKGVKQFFRRLKYFLNRWGINAADG